MSEATDRVNVGVRELKNNLSRHLKSVRAGTEIVVTDRGVPVARLSALAADTDHLGALIAAGAVRPPKATRRSRPTRRISSTGSVSELVADQRQ